MIKNETNNKLPITILAISVLLAFVLCFWVGGKNDETIPVMTNEETETEEINVDDEEGPSGSAGISRQLRKVLDEIRDTPVSKEYVEKDIVGCQAPVAVANYVETIPVEPMSIYTNSIGLNIRENPSGDGTVVASVPIGTELLKTATIETYEGDSIIDSWTQVEYNGRSGYVKSDYVSNDVQTVSLGWYEITYYCPCAACCDVANRQTASGKWPTEGVTIAADPSIPFGTELVIDGVCYTVQDRGGMIKGNKIDIFLNSHNESLLRGVHMSEVFARVGGDI